MEHLTQSTVVFCFLQETTIYGHLRSSTYFLAFLPIFFSKKPQACPCREILFKDPVEITAAKIKLISHSPISIAQFN
jgi:hypothetical protein